MPTEVYTQKYTISPHCSEPRLYLLNTIDTNFQGPKCIITFSTEFENLATKNLPVTQKTTKKLGASKIHEKSVIHTTPTLSRFPWHNLTALAQNHDNYTPKKPGGQKLGQQNKNLAGPLGQPQLNMVNIDQYMDHLPHYHIILKKKIQTMPKMVQKIHAWSGQGDSEYNSTLRTMKIGVNGILQLPVTQKTTKKLGASKIHEKSVKHTTPTLSRFPWHNLTAVAQNHDDDAEDPQTSCTSPTRSNSPAVSQIKEEPVDNPSQEGDLTKETTITAKRELTGKEVSASEADLSQQEYTIQPTDFTRCIICQKATDEELQNLTIEGVKNFRKIVVNKDEEIGKRLLNEVLDIKIFLNKDPKYHLKCRQDFKLENNRRVPSKETDFSHCIICQEITGEKLFNVTERGFPTIQFAVSNRKDLIAKRLAIYVYSQEVFLSFLPKIHRTCRKYVNRQRVVKSIKKWESKMKIANKEEDEDIIDQETGKKLSGEEMLELIKQQKHNEKSIMNVSEISSIDFGTTCFICMKKRSKIGKEKYVSLDKDKYDKIKQKAKSLPDNALHIILNNKNSSERKLKFHKICYKTYLDKPVPKLNLNNLPYDIAFTCLIKQIEEPLFKQGKAFDVSELRNEYRHYLSEQGIKSTIKAFKLSDKLKRYYTVPPKRCLVKIHTEVAQSSVVYSKHLSEEELLLEIERLKMCRKGYEEADDSENEAEQNDTETKANQEALQEIIGQNVISSGGNSAITIDKVFRKYKKIVKPKEPEQEYRCSECDYKGNQERALVLHMKKHQRELENPKEIMCEECGKIFHSKEACSRHKLTHGTKTFLCSHCGKDFWDKYTLKKHVLTHTAEKKYECALCNMKFITQFYLKKHLLIHTDEKPLMCTICGYTCKQKDRLKDHMSKHSDERPYVCNICGKSFKFRQPLRTHMLLHGEKPCKCPECDFRCYTKGNLKAHMRKHTGEKVYKEKVYKAQVEKPVKQIKPVNVNPEMGSNYSNIESNSCNALYSYPVNTQDPRLYFPTTRHFPHIPSYLFSSAQSADSQ
ncbi:unnamed protein product, partial [Meganyctiphanes norvegica]